MKNKRVTILLIITNIILIEILYSFIRINGSIIKERQIIKEMSESTQVTDLNNQINALNAEHTEYMNYIQTCKAQLASVITDMGVETSENASIDIMVNNIRSLSGASSLEINSVTFGKRINAGQTITAFELDISKYSKVNIESIDDAYDIGWVTISIYGDDILLASYTGGNEIGKITNNINLNVSDYSTLKITIKNSYNSLITTYMRFNKFSAS